MSFLEVSNLNQTLGKRHIVKNISLTVSRGEVVALLGPNGAGKTTLIRTIVGLLSNKKSDESNRSNLIYLNKNIINSWSVCKRVESGLIYLPQQPALFQNMSVIDNLKMVFNYHLSWKNSTLEKFEQEVMDLFKKIDLTCSFDQNAGSLSGGQKRKLEVIRSFLMRPKIVLFDEPFAGVDPKSIYELKKIFIEMAKAGIAILISDHHVDQLMSFANRIYVILDGKVVTSGGIKDILDDSCTRESYLGDQFYSEVSKRFLNDADEVG
jgi:lipopolysaccharide export system ATP-binding protein